MFKAISYHSNYICYCLILAIGNQINLNTQRSYFMKKQIAKNEYKVF